MNITNKLTITATVPLSECEEEHLSRTSIKNIVTRLATESSTSWKEHCRCAKCGIVADGYIEGLFATRNGNHEPLRGFYVASKRGNVRTLLTFDHIWPKSLGGRDASWNGQILCFDCNQQKSDVVSEEFVRHVLDNINVYVSSCAHRRIYFIRYIKQYFPHLLFEKGYSIIFEIDYSLGIPVYDY